MIRTLLLAATLSGCASGPWLDPRAAYQIERDDCRVNARGDSEQLRRCYSMVEKKYARYWSEGDYPPPVTSTPGPSDPR